VAKEINGIGEKETIDNQSDNTQLGDDQFGNKQNGIDKSAAGHLLENEQSGNKHSDKNELGGDRQINNNPQNGDQSGLDEHPGNDQSSKNQLANDIGIGTHALGKF
jgi:hypothetical protein